MLSFMKLIVAALVSLEATLTLAKPAGGSKAFELRTDLDIDIALSPKALTSRSFHNSVYFTNWGVYARNYQVTDLPASEISHVIYAFLNFGPNGTLFSSDSWADVERPLPDDNPANATGKNAFGNIKQLYKLKKANRHLKTMLSIGGWSLSAHFPVVARAPATRTNFAKSAVNFLKDWGFDGIDVDWEYPTDEQQANDFVLLLQAIRDELDSYSAQYADNHHFTLSIAAPAGPQRINVLKIAELANVLDHINLMAYDYAGSWDNTTGYNSAVFNDPSNPISTPFNTNHAVELYLNGGVPPNKLILGMPIYGRAFQNTTGIGQPYIGIGPGQWEVGVFDYKTLPKVGAKVVCDKKVIGCYSYDKTTRELISFDTPTAVRDKIRYAKKLSLGGSMFWEASADKKGEESLISTSYKSLRHLDIEPNWLSYPNSQYRNIATGMV